MLEARAEEPRIESRHLQLRAVSQGAGSPGAPELVAWEPRHP